MDSLSCSHYACFNELASFIISQIQKNCVNDQDLSCQICKHPFSNELIQKCTDSQLYQKVLFSRQNNQQVKRSGDAPQNYAQQVQIPQQNQKYIQLPMQQTQYPIQQIQPSKQMMQTQWLQMCKTCQLKPAVNLGQGIPLCLNCKNYICERCGQQIHPGNCIKPIV